MTTDVAAVGSSVVEISPTSEDRARLAVLFVLGLVGGLTVGLVLMYVLLGRDVGADSADAPATTNPTAATAQSSGGDPSSTEAMAAQGESPIEGVTDEESGAIADESTAEEGGLFADGRVHLVAGSLPPGLVLHNAADLPQEGVDVGAPGRSGHQLYSARGALSLRDGDLLVFHQDVEPGLFRTGDPVGVRAHSGTQGTVFGVDFLVWEEAPGSWVGLASRSLDNGELLDLAEGLEVGSDGKASLSPGDAESFSLRANADRLPIPFAEPREGSLVNYVASEGSELGEDASILVMTASSGPDEGTVLEWLAEEAEVTTIGGRTVTRLSFAPDYGMPVENTVLSWIDGDRRVVVAAFGLPDNTLPQIVAGLNAINAADWTSMLAIAGG